MDFGDLSDGSNDSFFDEPKSSVKRSSLSKTPEKKSITDIFNISDKTIETNPTPSKRADDWLGLDTKEAKSPLRTPKAAKKISFEDNDDILSNLGLAKKPQNVEESKPKKLDLLESILGASEETEKKTEDKKPSRLSLPPTEAPREGRRAGRRSSTGLIDPLGLFSSEPKEEIKEKTPVTPKPTASKSAPNVADKTLPDWLAAETPLKRTQSENITKTEETPAPSTEEPSLSTIMTQQKLAQSNFDFQNTSIALQQQESQLLIALQMKKYEEKLADMQMKQQEVLMKQEQQFNLLLERQFAKQNVLESNMRLQQERINNHIQMLIGQGLVSEKVKDNEGTEELTSSFKQRQHEEIFLLEESYKKQISLLEDSLDSVEKRLKSDIKKITENFEEQRDALQQQHSEQIKKYKEKIQEMESQHAEEMRQVRENNSRLIEEIKYEHSTLLENIRESKKSEHSLFQESSSYLNKLDSNIEILYSNSRSLIDLKDHIDKDYGVLSKAREESLQAKEKEISMMRQTLEKCRESAENERAELMTLVRTLENKLAEQNQNAREERWAFQQAANVLTARSAALDRETEFNRNCIEREREQLKTLKESLLAEQEKILLQLNEEKLAISAEKSRLETSAKLTSNHEAQAKAEIDAAVQMAKQATEMTDKERESLQYEKCQVEKLKRTLKDQERNLRIKQTEVENLMREAEMKRNEGENAILESKTIENRFKERLRDLQMQLASLASREKKIAEEKIALAQERLALANMARKTRNCSLCSAGVEKLDQKDDTPAYFPRINNIDEEILRLRLEAVDLNVKE